jgi:hypothetical protein
MVSHRNHLNKYLIDSLIPKIKKIKHAKMCQTFDNAKKGKIKHAKMCKT